MYEILGIDYSNQAYVSHFCSGYKLLQYEKCLLSHCCQAFGIILF